MSQFLHKEMVKKYLENLCGTFKSWFDIFFRGKGETIKTSKFTALSRRYFLK